MDNFTPIRNGILEHIRAGKLCPFDLGIYMFLHLTSDWKSGVCFTNARSIAVQFAGVVSAKDVRQSLYRLREKRYINYREGDGSRGSYNVLIHKSRPTVGGHVGLQLNAFAIGSLDAPVYESYNSETTVGDVSANSATTVISPLQDLKTLQDVQDVKREKRASQFPEGFTPNENHRRLAQELGVDLQSEFEAFRDDRQARGTTYKNWDFALNTWLRRAKEFRRGSITQGVREDRNQQVLAEINRRVGA